MRYKYYKCSELTSITIPNSVTNMGNYVFYGCYGLTSITIGNSVTNMGNYVFYECYGLTSITIGNSVTSIGEGAFWNCSGLTSIKIPNNVTSIGRSAFSGCSRLTDITISNSVTSIGDEAFSGTKWYENQPDGIVYAGPVLYKYKGSMPTNTNIVVKEETKGIADDAFKECFGLTSITIPNSVTSIGNQAFLACGLKSIAIPNNVTSIGRSAFSGCSRLTDITIPNSVTSIGDEAFSGTKWYENQPNGIVYAGLVLYGYKGSMPANTNIDVKEGTKGITAFAFNSCERLTNITIPNSVTNIGNRAFALSWLRSITIGNGVISIGEGAFWSCPGLTSIKIPNSVTSIGNGAFAYCNNLATSITIPNSVTTIGEEAFYECWRLTSITIGNSVTNIGRYAFYDCGLGDVTCLATTPPTTSSSFSKYGILHVLPGCRTAYENANEWKKFTIVEDAVDNRTITLGTNGYATYCSDVNLDFTGVEGIKAYIATGFNLDDGTLTITQVNNVPASEGILLTGTPEESYDIPVTDKTNMTENLFKGNITALTLSPTDDSYTNFILTMDSNDTMGFNSFTDNVSMPANNAWLQIPTTALGANANNIKCFSLIEDNGMPTGISNVRSDSSKSYSIFDLQGRHVKGKPAYGIYISNGKKVLSK